MSRRIGLEEPPLDDPAGDYEPVTCSECDDGVVVCDLWGTEVEVACGHCKGEGEIEYTDAMRRADRDELRAELEDD